MIQKGHDTKISQSRPVGNCPFRIFTVRCLNQRPFFFFLKLSASAPVSFTNAEGKGEVGGYFFKVLQRNVTILVLVVIFHDGLREGGGMVGVGAGEHWREKKKKDTTRVGSALV